MRPRVLDRYIAGEILGPSLIALVVFSFLFLVNLIFQLANLVIQEGLGPGAAGRMFLYSLPVLLSYTLPVGLLAGTIIAFGRLSADSEAVALRAAGLPVRSLLRAPLALGAALALALALSNFWLVPAARAGQERLQEQATRMANLMRMVKPGVFYDRVPGVLFYVEAMEPEKDRYEKVLIYQRPSPEKDMITVARWARLVEGADPGSLQFLLGPGQSAVFNRAEPEKVQLSSFDQQALTVVPARSAAAAKRADLSSMGPGELLQRMDAAGRDAPGLLEHAALRYEIHRRLSTALAGLLFALIGVPLGLANARGGRGAGFSLSLGVVLFYWILASTLGDLALKGRLGPAPAAWLPDLAVLAAGLYFLRRRWDRPAERRVWAWPALLRWPRAGAASPGPALERASQPAHAEGWLSVVDRYLLGHAARFFFLIAGALLVLDWIVELRALAEFLTGRSQWILFGKYLAGQSVGFFLLLLPLTLLMTTLVVLGILEKGNEVTALKAGGVSLYRISFTFLALAAAVGAAAWVAGESVAPAANRAAQRHRADLKHFVSKFLNVNYDVWLFAPGRAALYHYEHYDPKRGVFEGFSRYGLSPAGDVLTDRFYADQARFSAEKSLSFTAGWIWAAGTRFRRQPSGQMAVPVGKEYFVIPAYLEGQTLSSPELARLIEDLKAKGLPVHRQRMDYYRKSADAATPLALLLVGLPFAFSVGRRGSLYGVAIALALAVGFYILQAVFTAVGEMEWLDPALAAWAPPVLFGLAGGYWTLNLRS